MGGSIIMAIKLYYIEKVNDFYQNIPMKYFKMMTLSELKLLNKYKSDWKHREKKSNLSKMLKNKYKKRGRK